MSAEEIWKVTLAILTALGGGGAIVAALSSWIGKVWAERLMAKERAKHEADLTALRANLENEAAKNLARLQHELEIYKETHLRGLSDKLATYRLAVDAVSDVAVDITVAGAHGSVTPQMFEAYQRRRLKAFGYVSLLGSQEVMDTFASLTDYMEDIASGKAKYDVIELRRRTFQWVDAIRKDVGINPEAVKLGPNYSLPARK